MENIFIYENTECSFCKTSPIKGILYKCITCKSYNLCERCEMNYAKNHGHNFLKIRNNQDIKVLTEKYMPINLEKKKLSLPDKDGRLRCRKLRAGKNYNPLSYQVVDKKPLYCTKNNNNSLTIPLTLLNDGENDWPSPCFFTCLEEESNIFGKRIKLVKCSGKKNSTYALTLKLDLSKINKTGLYTSVWRLKNENGDEFGPKIMIKVSDVFENRLEIKSTYIEKLGENKKETTQKPITTEQFLKMKKMKK